MTLKIKKLKPTAQLPARATTGAAGADLCACLEEGTLTLQPMQRKQIPTGIAIELESPRYVALVFARSGLSIREGLALANGVGVIDSDYRGEILVAAVNLSQKPVEIKDGERVAQLVVLPVEQPDIVAVETLGETTRGTGGFGSTGRK